jgi:hypothetical protein
MADVILILPRDLKVTWQRRCFEITKDTIERKDSTRALIGNNLLAMPIYLNEFLQKEPPVGEILQDELGSCNRPRPGRPDFARRCCIGMHDEGAG